MKYVLDASIGLKWCLPESDATQALRLRDEFVHGRHELIAPDVFSVEIAHALSKALRQRRITREQAEVFYADILLTPPRLVASLPLLDRAYELALDLRARVYDCLYLALAEEHGCLFITADTRAVSGFQGFPVVDLANY